MADELVKRRCVIMIGDYEPSDVAQRFATFRQGLQQFAQTWSVGVRYSPPKIEAEGGIAVWHIEAKAPNWQVNTEFRLLNWSDLISGDWRRWTIARSWRALSALWNFLVTGACWRYVRNNWRFGLLFLYPVLMIMLFSVFALWLATSLANLKVPFALLAAFMIAGGFFAAFVKWLDPLDLTRIVDLWVFLHELIHMKREGLAERLRLFIQDVVAKLKSQNFDEIVVIGHGIGAALQPIILDRAFFALPEFGKGDGRSVNVLSIGSLLLAVGLHPEGAWIVSPTLRIAADRMVYWAEYQTREDLLNFSGTNPVAELVREHRNPGSPIVQTIRLTDMADQPLKRGLIGTPYQSHERLIQANTKRYFYDFFMVCCGPFPLPTRVKYPDLMLTAFGPDGRLVSS